MILPREKLVARRLKRTCTLLKSAKLVRLFWFMAARVGVFQDVVSFARFTSHVILSYFRTAGWYTTVLFSPALLRFKQEDDNKIIIFSLWTTLSKRTSLCSKQVQNLRSQFSSLVIIENNSHSNFSTHDPSRQCAPWINARGAIQHGAPHASDWHLKT